MKEKRSELFIGISITLATVIVIFGMLFLERATIFSQGLTINMVVENAQGIGKGSEVQYRGVKVGTVTAIKVQPEQVVVELQVEDVTEIPDDSSFRIGRMDLLGGKAVRIEPGSSTEHLANRARVQGSAGGGIIEGLTGLTDNLSSQLGGVEAQLSTLLENVNALLGSETHNQLLALLQESRSAADEVETSVAENSTALKRTLDALKQIPEENREPLNATITQLEAGTENLDATVRKIESVSGRLDELLRRIEAGQGTMGSVMEDEELYSRLIRSLEEVETLVKDIQENPDKYMSVQLF